MPIVIGGVILFFAALVAIMYLEGNASVQNSLAVKYNIENKLCDWCSGDINANVNYYCDGCVEFFCSKRCFNKHRNAVHGPQMGSLFNG